jgi:hypothetical protein
MDRSTEDEIKVNLMQDLGVIKSLESLTYNENKNFSSFAAPYYFNKRNFG